MSDPIEIVPYDANWITRFQQIAAPIRSALGDVALRIDHIGSTAVPNLAAKPIIDIQISVATFTPISPYREPLEALGYIWREDNPDLTKRYFREAPNTPRTHIHVRQIGSWSQQFALLFRDYLRVHSEEAQRYEAVKYELATQYRHDRVAYTDGKSDIIWSIIRQANRWSQDVGWQADESGM